MTTKKLISKEEEIVILESLRDSDSYFKDYFGNDIDLMCQNIRKDFGIECGTYVDRLGIKLSKATETIQTLESKISDLTEQHKNIVENLNHQIDVENEAIVSLEVRLKEIMATIIIMHKEDENDFSTINPYSLIAKLLSKAESLTNLSNLEEAQSQLEGLWSISWNK